MCIYMCMAAGSQTAKEDAPFYLMLIHLTEKAPALLKLFGSQIAIFGRCRLPQVFHP